MCTSPDLPTSLYAAHGSIADTCSLARIDGWFDWTVDSGTPLASAHSHHVTAVVHLSLTTARLYCICVPYACARHRNNHQEQKRRGTAESGAAERTGSARHPASDQKSPTKEPPVRSQRPQRRSTDKVVRRNKRMFGMLNATLKTASVKTGTQEKAVGVPYCSNSRPS